MEKQAIIRSVNTSKKKGEVKSSVKEIRLTDQGIEGDAHAGPHHRQVSLLAMESIRKYEQSTGSQVPMGGFGENITTEGFTLHRSHPLDRFQCGEVVLEMTQVGKKCHGKRCAIYKDTGECIMPDEGIFCRVIHEGRLRPGDRLEYHPKQFRLKVITLSDRAAAGFYPDRSGKLVQEEVSKWFRQKNLALASDSLLIPDEQEVFSRELSASIGEGFDLIITTGSTGLGSRDIAPEVAEELIDKEIPGIMDLIRVKYGMVNPNALLSRSVAGIAGKTLLFVLPGSTRAVREYLEEILKSLWHMILMVNDIDSH
jgi:molybdenum cofactor synthesis domain-containing protein